MTGPARSAGRGLGVAVVVAGIGALLWLHHTPQVGDLAAQTAYAQLARRAGYVPFFARWYGGVPVGGYSLLTPPLMAAFGVRAVGVLATLASAALAALLVGGARRPTAGAAVFALAACADLFSGRVTFAAGGAVALGAVLAAERRRPVPAAALGALAAVTSPVAGLFCLLPAAVLLLTDPPRRRPALFLGGGAAVALAAVSLAFPVGGYEPFADFVLRPALAIPLAAALLPVGRRVRVGLLLSAGAVLGAYLVHSPLGSNVTRLSILVVVPTLVAAARLPLLLLAPAALVLGLWPWHQLHDDLVAASDASARPSFVAGLAGRLRGDPTVATQRVEVLEPRTHWAQTRLVDAGVTVARGWLRQVDEGRNPLFYGRAPLTVGSYRGWLDGQGVAYVARPHGVPLDFGTGAEDALVGGGLPYLHPVWSDAHWTLYAVDRPAPVATGAAAVTALTDTGAQLAGGPGVVTIALHWSPYLVVGGGVVQRDGDRTRVVLATGGSHRLHAVWRWP